MTKPQEYNYRKWYRALVELSQGADGTHGEPTAVL